MNWAPKGWSFLATVILSGGMLGLVVAYATDPTARLFSFTPGWRGLVIVILCIVYRYVVERGWDWDEDDDELEQENNRLDMLLTELNQVQLEGHRREVAYMRATKAVIDSYGQETISGALRGLKDCLEASEKALDDPKNRRCRRCGCTQKG